MKTTDIIFLLAIFTLLTLLGIYFISKKNVKIKTHQPTTPINNNMSMLSLQAYERLIIFSERVGFKSLIERLPTGKMSAQELAYVFVEAIRNEFDFNLSQQIYVSEKSWQAIIDLKDQQIFIITEVVKTLPNESMGIELAKALLSFLQVDEKASLQSAVLETIRFEAKK